MEPQIFKTRRDVERYFSGDTIECLICGRHLKRLARHLAAKHNLSADHYKKQFGLAWTRGLTSATSLAKSGWTDERKAKARKLARNSRFFELWRVLINAGFGRMSALGANRTRRDRRE